MRFKGKVSEIFSYMQIICTKGLLKANMNS